MPAARGRVGTILESGWRCGLETLQGPEGDMFCCLKLGRVQVGNPEILTATLYLFGTLSASAWTSQLLSSLLPVWLLSSGGKRLPSRCRLDENISFFYPFSMPAHLALLGLSQLVYFHYCNDMHEPGCFVKKIGVFSSGVGNCICLVSDESLPNYFIVW